MPQSPMSRRQFLSAAGLALVAVACGGGGGDTPTTLPPAPGGSLDALKRGAKGLSLATSIDQPDPSNIEADARINPGTSRVSFALITTAGGAVSGGSPQVYAAHSDSVKALGPFAATWIPFTGYSRTDDHSPESPLPGTYAVDIEVPSSASGLWNLLAVIDTGSDRMAGETRFFVTNDKLVAAIGSKAVSVATPVATTEDKRKEICTRNPPDEMHAVSLDDALKNGKPTAVSFATPLLCESMLCGPVVDEQILAFQKYGKRANFVHVEEFLPGPSLSPGPATLENQSPGFKAYGFQSEPWVLVIDRKGVIRARLGPGPATAPEIEAALEPLL